MRRVGWDDSRGERQTYTSPIPKIAVKPSFFATGNCSVHKIGMGSIIMAKSMRRLLVPTATKAMSWLPQTASGAVRSQLA